MKMLILLAWYGSETVPPTRLCMLYFITVMVLSYEKSFVVLVGLSWKICKFVAVLFNV